MTALVSILIPAYNAQPWIGETLRSALEQTWPNKEIIVVDDGSRDQTLSISQKFASKAVSVITQENQGAAATRNRAFSLCQGDYVQWLDADDLLSRDKIALQMRAVEEGPDKRTLVSSAWGSFMYRPAKAKFVPTSLWCDLSPAEWLLRKWEGNLSMQTAIWLTSRELTEAAGPWDTRLLTDDDGEYFFRVIRASTDIRFVPGAKVLYRITASNRLSHMGRSKRKLEAQFLGMKLQIGYLLALTNDKRARAACVNYLKTWLPNFYPDRPDIVSEAQTLAESLGGRVDIPRMGWKFAWIEKVFGSHVAKEVQIRYNRGKIWGFRRWDGILYSLERPQRGMEVPRRVVCGRLEKVLPASSEADLHLQHLSTDHLLEDLKGRTISSGLITLTAQGVQFALMLASTMILARLLTPRDFGLTAMVWTVMGFLRVFREAGLSSATVQREGITHAQVSNLFWINAAVSGAISLLAAAAAPVIAWFYREPRLVGVTIALSTTFLLAGLAVQHMALLNRQMLFKMIALIQVGSVLAGVLVGVGMAWLNYGYWSLVGLNMTTSIVALLLAWSLCRWRPQSFTRHSGTRVLLHFGANLTAGAFIHSLARGLDGLLIGRFYGAASVGLYSRATALSLTPLAQFSGPVEAVFIPALSRLQTQPDRYRSTFLQVYETIALVSCFFSGMLFALAHPLTLVVLGRKWQGAAIIFAGFTFAALQYPLGSSASWLFTSQGRGRESFIVTSIMAIIIAASFIAGLPFGPAGVAIAYSSSCLLIQMPIYYWLVGRRGPVGTADLWFGFLRQLPMWGIVALVVWLVRLPIPDEQPFKELFIAAPAGLLAGAAFIFLYSPARRVAVNLFSTLRGLKSRGGNFWYSSSSKPLVFKLGSPDTGRALSSSAPPRQVILGLLTRKERWGLSWRGWLIVSLVSLSAAVFVLSNVHSFLAVTDRGDANVLVVEGWLDRYAIRAAVQEFQNNRYKMVYTTGGPVHGADGYTNDYNTWASVGADLLKKSGLPAESVQMVPSHVTDLDRTYRSAVALRNWFLEHNVHTREINVVTEDVHARRTRLLFQEAFGREIKVGIIAAPNGDYDANHWWRSSEGFRDVIGEAIAYLYAKLFFYPPR